VIDVNKAPVTESTKYKVVMLSKKDKLSKDWKKKNYSEKALRRVANKQKTLIVTKSGSPKFKGKNVLKIVNPNTKKAFVVFKKKSEASETNTFEN